MALLIANAAVFALMTFKGVPLLHPSAEAIRPWGANFGPLTLGGQWWRMLTAAFVHIGLTHLLVNAWCLWDLGFMAEQLYGGRTFLAVYLLSALSGSLVSVAYNPFVVSAGASGAIFGVAGALIATLYLGHIPAPPKALRASLVSLLVFAGFNLIYGFREGGIDNGAHVGGLVAGLLLGAVLSRDFGTAPDQHHAFRKWAFPVFAAVLLIGTLGVRHYHQPHLQLEHAEETLARGDKPGALREVNAILQAHPKFVDAWRTLGTAYLSSGNVAEAEKAFTRASELDPKASRDLAQLGLLYLRAGRYDDALRLLDVVVRVDPKYAEAWVNRGVALNQLGRQADAIESLKKAVALNGQNAVSYYNLGLAYMALKRYDEAIGAFQKVTQLAPKDGDSWVWLANAYENKGMSKEANEAYSKGYALRMKGRKRQ